MKLGIIGNTTKPDICSVVMDVANKLRILAIPFFVHDDLREITRARQSEAEPLPFYTLPELMEQCDILVSIGGDGTLLSSAVYALAYDKPIIGFNYGNLGFLAEAELRTIDTILAELNAGRYEIEQRTVLKGFCSALAPEFLYAVNDIVIDKGRWTKMIRLGISMNDEFITTISADGVIIATPTGSTGYSLSVGGPIVVPTADVITLSPIAPHSLSVRPLVVPSTAVLTVKVESHPEQVQVTVDGQRDFFLDAPVAFSIGKSEKPLRIVRPASVHYFDILRNKLFWGIDLRNLKT